MNRSVGHIPFHVIVLVYVLSGGPIIRERPKRRGPTEFRRNNGPKHTGRRVNSMVRFRHLDNRRHPNFRDGKESLN